jgi:phosphoserine phosphatase RsbU/P
MKILVAEDDFASRLILQVVLEKWKYEVISVSDGKEAWDVLKQKDAPSIAILDWEMPELDGVGVCSKVKELERDNPIYVIILTGRTSKEDIVQGLDAGADDYVTKPFDENELRARIRVAERMVNIQASLSETVEELRQALELVHTLQNS